MREGKLICEELQTADTGAVGQGSHGSPMANLVTLAARHSGSKRNTEFWSGRLGCKAVVLGQS